MRSTDVLAETLERKSRARGAEFVDDGRADELLQGGEAFCSTP